MVNNNKIIKEKLRIILENKYLNIRMWSDKIHWLEKDKQKEINKNGGSWKWKVMVFYLTWQLYF